MCMKGKKQQKEEAEYCEHISMDLWMENYYFIEFEEDKHWVYVFRVKSEHNNQYLSFPSHNNV